MERAIVLSEKDIKAMIAEKFQVHEEDVIKTKYSYVVKCVEFLKEAQKQRFYFGGI